MNGGGRFPQKVHAGRLPRCLADPLTPERRAKQLEIRALVLSSCLHASSTSGGLQRDAAVPLLQTPRLLLLYCALQGRVYVHPRQSPGLPQALAWAGRQCAGEEGSGAGEMPPQRLEHSFPQLLLKNRTFCVVPPLGLSLLLREEDQSRVSSRVLQGSPKGCPLFEVWVTATVQ